MMEPSPIGLIVRWIVPLWLLGWLVLPFSRRLLPNLPDGGLAAGRILTLFLASLWTFWTAALQIFPLTLAPLWLLALPLAAVWLYWRHPAARAELFTWIGAQRRALLVSDLVFLLGYAMFLWIRLRNPTVFDLEKPMDAALMASAARAVWLPFENPWLSGVPFTNYYYFGPLMAANLARTFFTPIAFAYNLVQPLFCALFLSVLWSLCASITQSVWRGLVGMSVVGLMGHFEPLRQMYESGQWSLNPTQLNWWSTSRVVPDSVRGTREISRTVEGNPIYTINEYPIFTLSIGDAHAHFYALAMAALLFCLCWALLARPETLHSADQSTLGPTNDTPDSPAKPTQKSRKAKKTPSAKTVAANAVATAQSAPQSTLMAEELTIEHNKRRRVLLVLLGTLLGGFVITNTWDAPLYSLLVITCALLSRPNTNAMPESNNGNKANQVRELLWCVVPLFMAPLVALPYLLRFKSQIQGEETDIIKGVPFELWWPNTASFLLFWGGWLLLALVAWIAYCFQRADQQVTQEREHAPQFVIAMSVFGLIAIVAPCFFYIRGYFGNGDFRHQDTVFKFYSQAWLLLGTGAACGALWLLARTRPLWRRVWSSVWALCWIVPFMCGSCVFLWRGINHAAREANGSVPLSLDGSIPSSQHDAAAMEWLRRHAKPGEAVLEAIKPGSYTEFGRVAALTGVPTPLGWSQHVWYWGAKFDVDIDPRKALIERVYNWSDDGNGQAAIEELKKFNLRYIFIGDLEHRTYPPEALQRLREKFPVVFEQQQTFILRV
jgi:uncharacterized membrane protein